VTIDEHVTPEQVTAHPEVYRGAVVLAPDWPTCSVDLPDHPANSYDAVVTPETHALMRAFVQGGPAAAEMMQHFQTTAKVMAALAPAGAAAIIRNSCMPDALLRMGSAGGDEAYQPSPLPVGYVSYPDYQWLMRLARADKGTLRLNLAGTLTPGPVPVANVVAQIRGSDHPDEQVIIGAHLDSWDLGEGAVDNGTGAAAVLEAARLLKALGWTPKRTLTFVLFYGEEQGEMGSRQFVHEHTAEMGKIDAVLVDDVGAGRITSIPIGAPWGAASFLDEIYQPLADVFDLSPMTAEDFEGSDHDQFRAAGVPAYLAVQEAAHYGYAHHSNADVFELVSPDALRQQAAVLAAWMWNVSELPTALPHQVM
jgi:Zn-dependent M28 family amino/carboxypeptidase